MPARSDLRPAVAAAMLLLTLMPSSPTLAGSTPPTAGADAPPIAASKDPPSPPGWYVVAELPEDWHAWGPMDGRDDFLLLGGRGEVRHLAAGRWVVSGPDALPGVVIDDARRAVVRSGLVVSPTEAYVYGTRQTIYRWDGARWSLEHQDLRTGERSAFELRQCEGRLYATDRWSTKVREADGTWTSLGRVARPCAEQTVPSPEDCWRHGHRPGARVVWCRSGLHIWDDAGQAWRRHPASRAEARMPIDLFPNQSARVHRWQVGDTLLVAVGPRVYGWSEAGWVRVFETHGADVDRIAGTTEPLLVVGPYVWGR